jgi:hypothetical protein
MEMVTLVPMTSKISPISIQSPNTPLITTCGVMGYSREAHTPSTHGSARSVCGTSPWS